jgi:non-ribosomal peptide synthetase component F
MEIDRKQPADNRPKEAIMAAKEYRPGEPYAYPLILKKLLATPLIYSPDREIVYRDKTRITYRTLNERINRLANGLTRLGVKPGDVVAAFEFDSHRYLECFFAVPGMGATLQTVNWRLSPEQIVYTINHAEANHRQRLLPAAARRHPGPAHHGSKGGPDQRRRQEAGYPARRRR